MGRVEPMRAAGLRVGVAAPLEVEVGVGVVAEGVVVEEAAAVVVVLLGQHIRLAEVVG